MHLKLRGSGQRRSTITLDKDIDVVHLEQSVTRSRAWVGALIRVFAARPRLFWLQVNADSHGVACQYNRTEAMGIPPRPHVLSF